MRKLALAVLLPAAVVAGCSRPADEPAKRDLTLLADVDTSKLAVVSPRELLRSDPEPQAPVAAPTAVRPQLVPVRKHAKPAAPTPAAHSSAPVATPNASPTPHGPPLPTQVASAPKGAGTPLDPGQSVTQMPAASSTNPGTVPGTDASPLHELGRGIIIIGDDRCVPGRGELLPRWRHSLR
jgi:hypothetical protein